MSIGLLSTGIQPGAALKCTYVYILEVYGIASAGQSYVPFMENAPRLTVSSS